MEANRNFPRRGAGCPPGAESEVPDLEVLPPMSPRNDNGQISIGRVAFNRDTTFNSPCFWLLLGIGIGGLVVWQVAKRR